MKHFLCKKEGVEKTIFYLTYVAMDTLICKPTSTFYENLKEMSYTEEELAMALVRITKRKSIVISDFRSKR